jgi:hypothetical protein
MKPKLPADKQKSPTTVGSGDLLGITAIKSRLAKNNRKPMRLCVSLDAFGDGVVKHLPVGNIYHKVCRSHHNLVITDEMLDSFRKSFRNTLPKNQGIVLMADSALARRMGNSVHKLRKAYVVPSIDEFFDLVFHKRVVMPNEKS